MNGFSKVASVILFSGFGKELTYIVPDSLVEKLLVGSLVKVPLRGTMADGVVCDIKDYNSSDYSGFKLKNVYSVVGECPVLTKELFDLARWIASYYACTVQQAVEAMLPAVVKSGKEVQRNLEIRLSENVKQSDIDALKTRAKNQYKICEYLSKNKFPVLRAALCKSLNVSPSSVEALIEKNIVCQRDTELLKFAFDDDISQNEVVAAKDLPLNEQQQNALNDICAQLAKNKFKTHLLYGVTGSGKTEVYIRAMRSVLENGGSCIFMVPEISLTPQTVGRLRSKLNLSASELVVWHSNLSDGQRLQAWKSMINGSAKVAVGARSCVFAPMQNLKLIIVDEEHDTAYKQENMPRYNARDLAVYRASLNGALALLGSATPSLETLYNVQNAKYSISKMTSRVDDRAMPKIMLVDMKREKPNAIFSNILRDKVLARLDCKEQVILFLNRRGYSKLFQCPDCGYVATCPNCSVSLTWHRKEDYVMCHMCGHKEKAPQKCPNCGSPKAKWKSFGTQKVEEYISQTFPQAKVARIDADTMKKRDEYRRIFGEFRKGNIDMLVGTQMISKGLDFPKVTLVGILNADISLNMEDFRANERTYQLIVQVSGRAGRGTGDGEVIVQTMNPDAPPIQYARKDNLEDFLKEELENRMRFSYPPAKRLIRHIFRSRNPDKLAFYCEHFAKKAELELGSSVLMRGPAPAPIEKIQEYYRWHLWYFCTNVRSTVEKIMRVRNSFTFDKDIEDVLDVDPYSTI